MSAPAPSRPEARVRLLGACRPTVLFVAAFALNSTPHEVTHAIVAYLLGFPATIFQLWATPETAGATPRQLAAIAAAGPLFSLALGLVSWASYGWRFRARRSGLIWLMLAIAGTYFFLGPLAGSALGGDFHRAFRLLSVPRLILFVFSVLGFVALPLFMFFSGRELVRWAPRSNCAAAVLSTTVAPWLLGTLLLFAVYYPLPQILVGPTASGSLFWIFAVAGAAWGYSRIKLFDEVSWSRWDLVIVVLAVVMVRIFALGIRLG